MTTFTVSSDKVQFSTAAVGASDVYLNGVRLASDGKVKASTSASTITNQGVPMTADGQVSIVDATAGLPADTVWLNGVPISSGQVCYSTGTVTSYLNGMPYVANGALAATITA